MTTIETVRHAIGVASQLSAAMRRAVSFAAEMRNGELWVGFDTHVDVCTIDALVSWGIVECDGFRRVLTDFGRVVHAVVFQGDLVEIGLTRDEEWGKKRSAGKAAEVAGRLTLVMRGEFSRPNVCIICDQEF